jgi:hypothetical protein
MLHINNNTKMNFILEALPLDAATRIGAIIVEAIEEISYPVTEETIGDLTIKEFEDFLVDKIDARALNEEDFHADTKDENLIRFHRFADILEGNTFRETIIV